MFYNRVSGLRLLTTEESGLGTVERTREWQEKISNSKLLVLPGKSYHDATSDAETCAEVILDVGKGDAWEKEAHTIYSGTLATKREDEQSEKVCVPFIFRARPMKVAVLF